MGRDESPQAEMVVIGTELLLGQVADTNSCYVGKEFANTGVHLSHITIVGDDFDHIVEALKRGLVRSDILLTSGGLGPTEDDLTRDAIARATGQDLIFHHDLMTDIEAFFKRRGLRMVSSNRKQAYIPRGAHPIRNPMGTAPGFIMEARRGVVIALPGVPRELKCLLASAVIPFLRRRFGLGTQIVLTRVLRVAGLGESAVDREIGDLIRESQNPRIGLLASPGDIRISIVCKARGKRVANRLIDLVDERIRGRLGTLIYGVDHETLEQKVAEELHQLNLRVAIAETITGGSLCQRLQRTGTGAFLQGFVLPSMDSQMSFLGLPQRAFLGLIKDPEVWALTLARKLLDHADVGLGLTGDFRMLKGELMGTLAVSTVQGREDHTRSWRLGGHHDDVTSRASIMALDMLRRHLLEKRGVES